MASRVVSLVVSFVLTGALGTAWAGSEPVESHTQHPIKTVVLDNKRIVPSTLTMGSADSLVFENHSVRPMEITFTSPDDLKDRIRCGLIRHDANEEQRAPWLLFAWSDGKLRATIPPGRFASVCSLQKGSYGFTSAIVGMDPRAEGSGGGTPEKGQIVVQ